MKLAEAVSWSIGALAIAILSTFASPASAETQFNLNPPIGAAVDWTSAGTWDQPGFPNGTMHVANLSRPLASPLTANIGAGEITLAGLTMGGTTSAVTTNIAGPGLLIFQNDDAGYNAGIPLVTSAGVPGSTNSVSVPVRLNEQLDFSAASINNIHFQDTVFALGTAPSIRSFMPAGRSVKIENLNIDDPDNPGNFRKFFINNSAGSPPGMPTINTQGTIELGHITGYGEITVGVTASQHPVPLGTVIFSGPNEILGYVQINRANIVLATDNSMGLYGIYGGQPNQGVGMNLISTDDSRVESAPAELSQWFTIKGAHSLTWNGIVVQSNTRGWINLLPPGKTFTLNEGVYAVADEDTERTFTFDGTGLTAVNGGLHDKYVFNQGPVDDGIGHFRKTGTGTVVVGNNFTSTYHGNTTVEAGTLRFGSAAHLANSPAIISSGGALGVDTGIYSDPAILAKLDTADTGGMMLTPAESAMNLDFTAAPLSSAAAASVAAPEAGLTYTGTITPAGSYYRLGGGTGTLTLPNQNQLTGEHGLTVTNGGEVKLAATNNYSGPTIISDYAFTSRTNQAIADTTNGISQSLFAPTTLTVSSLKSGGFDSSIGNSSNDAANLVIRGSTLRIDGETDKIQRLFTIGARGATIETVGLTRAFFEKNGPLAVEPAGPGNRTFTLGADSIVNGMSPLIQDAPDGGIVGLTKTGPGMWRLSGNNTYNGPTRVEQGRLNIDGTHSGAGAVVVDAGATFGGYGAVGGSVTVSGTFAPTRGPGAFQIAGNLTFGPESEFVITIDDGPATGQFSRVEVGGTAELAGTLRVELPNKVGGPYVPQLGDIFPFLAASGGAGGNFDLDLPLLSPGLQWQINPGDVTVFLNVVAALEGDYNFNGIVDAADYTVWRDSLGQQGIGLAADGDLSQTVDEGDYTFWKTRFGNMLAGAGQSLSEPTSVPEPTSLLLLLLAAASIVPTKRR